MNRRSPATPTVGEDVLPGEPLGGLDAPMEDSDEGYAYSYDDSEYSEASEISDGDFVADAEVVSTHRKAKYAIFREDELKERQKEAIQQVTSVLGVSPAEAARVLRYFKWDANRVNEEWWADTDAVREKLGLQAAGPEPSTSGKRSSKLRCNICFEEFKTSSMCAASCKHYFCKDCWHGYVSNAISQGPTVLSLRCPVPDCNVAVPTTIVREVASEEEWARFQRYELRSYVEDNRSLEWCPAPDCQYAVESLVDLGGEPMDVQCPCGCSFCFTCKEEAHRPVDCATVKKWISKNSAESENLNWILANTKPCPQCKRPIEKNQGCMHMTCSQCSHQFCWLCLAAWSQHGEGTGGFYACNRYELARQRGEYDEEAQKREHAKQALERYMHYYQRWAENDKARMAAAAKLKATQEATLEKLSNLYATPTSQLKFITDAWNQVVECRRILRWTYAFGYYSFDETARPRLPAAVLKQRQDFFEFNQGQAEYYLEKLHGVAEREMEGLANPEQPASLEEWAKFREKLIGLTDVTRSHLEKLVQELEKGLDKMMGDYNAPAEEQEEAMADAPSTASRPPERKREKPKPAAVPTRTRAAQRSAGAAAGGSSQLDSLLDLDSEAEESLGFWQCAACTFANPDLLASHCEVCDAARQRRS